MHSPTIYFFVNGILTNPANLEGWTDHACTWIQTHTPFKAEKFEYFCTAILKQLYQARRTEKLCRMLEPYHEKGFIIRLIGHSNGCDIICRLLRESPFVIDEVHLIAAATNENCRINGINNAFSDRRLKFAYYYCSQNDEVLRLGNNSFLRSIYRMLGYGFLGFRGPKYQEFSQFSATHWHNGYGHGSWFNPGLNFEKTMTLIVNHLSIG